MYTWTTAVHDIHVKVITRFYLINFKKKTVQLWILTLLFACGIPGVLNYYSKAILSHYRRYFFVIRTWYTLLHSYMVHK